MAATPKRASLAEAALVGQPWSAASIELAAAQLGQDFQPVSDHRARRRTARWSPEPAARLLRGDEAHPVPRLPEHHTGTVITYL